jgi:hypothetical protein
MSFPEMSIKNIQSKMITTGLPEKTPIVTDQGIISIQNIDTNYHTINNKKIDVLICTIIRDKFLVCFKKHSLTRNYPNGNTIMSCEHKIEFRGMFIESRKFVGIFPNVIYIRYNDEPLYNIHMSNHSKIFVNNLACETLNPQNPIVKLYNSSFCNEIKNRILLLLNKSIDEGDYGTYSNLMSQFK